MEADSLCEPLGSMCDGDLPTRFARWRQLRLLQSGGLIYCLIALFNVNLAIAQYPSGQLPFPSTQQHCPDSWQVWRPVSPLPESAESFVSRHKLSVIMNENLANAFVRTETNEDGTVRDQILGAEVFGSQTTRARSEVDFVPCSDQARMFVHLRGTTLNNVSSWTPQAVIRSQGNYRFQLSKQLDLKGLRISTRSPAAYFDSRQLNLAANTPGDPIPLVGPIAGMVALQTAERQKPLAEQIAAQRITRQIAPRFNDSIDVELASINGRFDALSRTLSGKLGELSKGIASETTDHEFRFGLGESGWGLKSQLTVPDAPLVVVLHEELINLLVRNLPLAGFTVSDAEIDRALDLFRKDPEVLWKGAPEGAPNVPPTFARLKFSTVDPVQVRFQDQVIEVRVRMGFEPLVGPEVPTQEIVLQFRPQLQENGLHVESSLVDITPADPVNSPPLPALVTSLLKQQVSQRLLPMTIPPRLPIPHEGRGPQELRLVRMNVQHGFMFLGYETPGVDVP